MKIFTIFAFIFVFLSISEGTTNGGISTVPKFNSQNITRTSGALRWVAPLENGADEIRIGSLDANIFFGTKKVDAGINYVEVGANITDGQEPVLKFTSDGAQISFTRQKGSITLSTVTVSFVPNLIIEYGEGDGIEGFDPEYDFIKSVIDISTLVWKPLSLTKSQSADGANYYVVTGETNTELFGFRFAISDSDLVLGGSGALKSQSSKIDLWIRYFNATANYFGYSDDARSQVALFATLESVSKSANVEYSYRGSDSGTNGFSTTMNGTDVGFSWSLDAQTNNGFIRVVSEVSQNYTITFGDKTWTFTYKNSTNTQFITYSFLDNRPEFIYWDPTIGSQKFSPQVEVVPKTYSPSSEQKTSVSENVQTSEGNVATSQDVVQTSEQNQVSENVQTSEENVATSQDVVVQTENGSVDNVGASTAALVEGDQKSSSSFIATSAILLLSAIFALI